MSKVSLASQIAAVEAAAAGKTPIGRAQVELQQQHLTAALQSLRWLDRNARPIQTFIDGMKDASGDRRSLIEQLLWIQFPDACIADLIVFLENWDPLADRLEART